MRNDPELHLAAATKTINEYSALIGRAVIQHEWINSEIRRTLAIGLERPSGTFPAGFDKDAVVFENSARKLQEDYISALPVLLETVVRGSSTDQEFKRSFEKLKRFLSLERSIRNRIVHSEWAIGYDGDPEMLIAQKAGSKHRPGFALTFYSLEDLRSFGAFQRKLYEYLYILRDTIFEGEGLEEEFLPEDEAIRRVGTIPAREYWGKWFSLWWNPLMDIFKDAEFDAFHKDHSDQDQHFENIFQYPAFDPL